MSGNRIVSSYAKYKYELVNTIGFMKISGGASDYSKWLLIIIWSFWLWLFEKPKLSNRHLFMHKYIVNV